uniref:Polygalacturonase n=1 Tax=Oryza punctata TaxID=4537 RepID=A0A0E0JJY1_ORYPU
MRRCFSPVGMLIAGAILCLMASTAPAARSAGRTMFSVSSFGAAGNGIADDSEIDGDVLAPPGMGYWPKARRPLQWLNFKWLDGFTIQGTGTVDGQSTLVRSVSPANVSQHWYVSGVKPTLIRFYSSFNVSVRNIRITNSPQCHLKFDSSGSIRVKNITISSPGDSLNTDGIHLQNTRDVEIRSSSIGCGKQNYSTHRILEFRRAFATGMSEQHGHSAGDDCISIQTGCSNVHMKNINCNPGHGISLGGLGKDNSLACVSDVLAEHINVENALYGVRIKTWQGTVRNVTFSNVRVANVATPIAIDQFYCDGGGATGVAAARCGNRTDAVEITGVAYRRVVGTYTYQPVHLACSDARPCTGVSMVDVRLSPASEPSAAAGLRQPLCWKSYGEAMGMIEPIGIACMERSNGLVMPLNKPFNYTC